MIHLFINALSASAGGGLTYIRNVLPCLAARPDVSGTVLVSEALRGEIAASPRLTILTQEFPSSAARRFWSEQCLLPSLIRRSGADVLLSTGNFALFRSPVPQILLSRNALYLSSDFLRDLRERGDYRLWIDTKFKSKLARWSVQRADGTVAPSETFADDLRNWTGKNVAAIHHGFNPEAFVADTTPLPRAAQEKLDAAQSSLRVLFVSHYNYYRNFETLIHAIAALKRKLHPRTVRLLLTCKLDSSVNPGAYRANCAAALVEKLNLREEIVELGAVPYPALHHLYRRCHVYATPAYAETFAHPLVEAMASGLPVVASDIPVHREICRGAALYFARFSPEDLSEQVLALSQSSALAEDMRAQGLSRSRAFSWQKHVDHLLELAGELSKAPLAH
jgi:glycosyltransferase involved in cell wall biosynthesis